MEVIDGLPAIDPIVDDQAVTIGDALLTGDFRRHPKEMSQQCLVCRGHQFYLCQGLLRDDQDMNRSLGAHIPKSQAQVILIDDVSGNFPVDDLGEDGHG